MSKTYEVLEVYTTLHGLGSRSGTREVVVKLATTPGTGQALDAEALVTAVKTSWGKAEGCKWVLFRGGDPTQVVDATLCQALEEVNFNVAVETPGTSAIDENLYDFRTCLPDLTNPPTLDDSFYDEVLVTIPGAKAPDPGWTEDALVSLEGVAGTKRVVPEDPSNEHGSFLTTQGTDQTLAGIYQLNLQRCISFVDRHPDWALCLDVAKLAGVPL